MCAKSKVMFSHPGKKYFPSGFTKLEMIQYYVGVSAAMLPHLRNRPLTLVRFPEGVKGESFYEKNVPKHAPGWIKTFAVPRREHEGNINYILANNVETLAWCANLGAIEFHPFLHRVPQLEQPTHVAFDLDPGDGANLLRCIEVGFLLKEVFAQLGLEAFPKVSGSKGLQLYLPLNTAVTYAATTPFAKSVADLLARRHPKLIVSEMSKALRRGRVMIDWSQNSASKTTVCAYSMRGKRDEPFISTPVTWEELEKAARRKDQDSLYFSPAATIKRVKKLGDLFAPVLTLKQKLPAAFMSLPVQKTARSSLRRYAEKRDFTRTAEPAPEAPAVKTGKQRFVIQKHAASHLHFDFRLEMAGVLKSWAVPKGLPYELGVKRSAFEVEDHPIDYLDFEGTIPQGQYGGGTVMVWDIGTYELLGGNIPKGDLKLRLRGKKLKGEWHLFRIRSENNKPVWLVAKSGVAMKPLSETRENTSVLTRRTMEKIARDNDKEWKSNR
jgi:bifunctional non-homologous end joining protein LigD